MGSIRIWALALVAGLFVVVVARERAHAPAQPAAPDSAVIAPAPRSEATPQALSAPGPGRVTGLPDFSALVSENGPAVVNISVVEKPQHGGNSADSDDEDPLSQFFRRYRRQNPDREPPSHGIGSGFIVSPDGYVLTNAHVVMDASEVTVKLTDRREFAAKVVGVDKRSDVAVIKIAATGLPTVRFGDSAKLKPGQWVVAIGSPFGFDNSVTAGVVSAVARPLDETYVPFIQTDAAVNPGNSGGPLFNVEGQVIGINAQIFSRTGGYMGMSFAVPIDLALSVKNQLLAKGRVSRSRIGVSVQEVDQKLAQTFGLGTPHGALVSSVEPKGPGEKAGLKPGDVITSVNGRKIDHSYDLPTVIAEIPPGSQARIGIWHDHKAAEVEVKTVLLEDEPAQVARRDAEDGGGKLGLAVRQLDAKEQEELHTHGKLVVEDVAGPALAAGIESGDVVLGVNGAAVNSAADLKREVARSGHSVALLIQRDDAQIYVPVDIG
ncbi:MAG: Do family serine endopeptidase [Actinobacteria bacterium]|nr:Do family serine endopeptidase [Actinomycetota bacterium]